MTDLEINKALAVAIGWKPEQMRVNINNILMLQATDDHFARSFNYQDWNVIGPIAAKYNAFPCCTGGKWWIVGGYGCPAADTPQKAAALAVIHGGKNAN